MTVGTLYERSKIPLSKWLAATHLMMASKKGMSALQVGRMLGLSKKTAWFLCHRIRESLRETKLDPMGGDSKTAEADESHVGGKEKNKHANKRIPKKDKGPTSGKEPVFALVECNGAVRSFHVPDVKGSTLREIVEAHLDGKTVVYTDDNRTTKFAVQKFETGAVNHSIGEYVRGDIHTNTIESYFAIIKRGIYGVYHDVSQQHLKCYLAEYDYRYNERSALGVSDAERFAKSVKGIVGKRLTYRRTGSGANV